MNEKIQQHIEVILQSLIKASEITVDFSKQEVPLLLREILTYYSISNLLQALGFIFIIAFVFKSIIPQVKK